MNTNGTLFRVYNKCKFDIGVQLANGMSRNIKAGSFQLLSGDDIAYIEATWSASAFFGRRMLVVCDGQGNEINLEELGVPEDTTLEKNMSDEEIQNALKQSVKKVEAWIAEVQDPVQLHAIYEVAKEMDLPASKLKILSAKIPNKDWLDEGERDEE